MGTDLDDISDEFDGQGHRSKVKVAMLKNAIFGASDGLAYVYMYSLSHHLVSCCDIVTSHDVLP